MEITSLKCNNCGANLEINPNIKFFTCTFCNSSLTVKKSGNVMFTEVLEDIKKNTESLIDNSEQMLVEKKIARLDREWTLESQKYLLKGNKGENYHPESVNGFTEVAGGIFAVIFGIFWMIWTSTITGELTGIFSLFPLFGIVIIGFAIFHMMSNLNTKDSYKSAKSRYLNERNRLLSELEEYKER
ncbi:MAG: hypothetical protein AB8F94_21370 [Saprospiraceae bacterium]